MMLFLLSFLGLGCNGALNRNASVQHLSMTFSIGNGAILLKSPLLVMWKFSLNHCKTGRIKIGKTRVRPYKSLFTRWSQPTHRPMSLKFVFWYCLYPLTLAAGALVLPKRFLKTSNGMSICTWWVSAPSPRRHFLSTFTNVSSPISSYRHSRQGRNTVAQHLVSSYTLAPKNMLTWAIHPIPPSTQNSERAKITIKIENNWVLYYSLVLLQQVLL